MAVNSNNYRVEFIATRNGVSDRRTIHIWSTTISGAIRKATAVATADWYGHETPELVEIRAEMVGKGAVEYAEAR
jgi:hypothetical protein